MQPPNQEPRTATKGARIMNSNTQSTVKEASQKRQKKGIRTMTRTSTILAATVCGLMVAASAVQAELIVQTFEDTSGGFPVPEGGYPYPEAWAPVSSTDLANQGQPSLLSFTGGQDANRDNLNDGVAGAGASIYDSTNPIYISIGTFTFTFDISVNTKGYDITQIDTIFGTGSNPDRTSQGYRVTANFVGGGSAVIVPKQNFIGYSGTRPWSKVTLTDSTGLLATGVQSLTFDQFTTPAGLEIANEFDVFGRAVPEPSTLVVTAVGLVGLLAGRKRRVL